MPTVHAIYQVEDGRLVSWTTDASKIAPAATLAARGYVCVTIEDADPAGRWNPTTHTFEPVAPEAARILTPLQFRDRFTHAEEVAITAAAAASVDIRVWLDRLAVAQEISLDDARTIAGVGALEAAGLLAAGRAAEILT